MEALVSCLATAAHYGLYATLALTIVAILLVLNILLKSSTDKSIYIASKVLKGMQVEFAFVSSSTRFAGYSLVIKTPGALRTFLWEEADVISGFSRAYKHDRLEVTGDFNRFMDDLVLLRSVKLSIVDRARLAVALFLLPKDTNIDQVAPFRSTNKIHSIERDKEAVAYHYDLSNDFYALFLSKNMLYTAGVVDKNDPSTTDFDRACEKKLEAACEKLELRDGLRVLDVGCGWGGMVQHVAEHYPRIDVTGVTISMKQVEWATAKLEAAHIPASRARVLYKHVKELDESEKFDRIVAFQCTEHMIDEELYQFFEKMRSLLKDDGILLVEFMTTKRFTKCHPFFDNFIFPDGAQFPIHTAVHMAERAFLDLKDIDNMREDYLFTIAEWNKRLRLNMDKCVALVGRERYRMWTLYLLWAEYLYSRGKSGCYTCVWTKCPTPAMPNGRPWRLRH